MLLSTGSKSSRSRSQAIKIAIFRLSLYTCIHQSPYRQMKSHHTFQCLILSFWTYKSFHWQQNIFNTLWPRQNSRHFPDDSFKCIFLNEIIWISIKISLKFVPGGRIYNIPALVQVMAWRQPGDKPLSEPMMVSSLTHICVTRPQWVHTWLQ